MVKVQLTIPAHEAVDVPVDHSIRVQFDRFLSPLSVMRQSICIASVGPATSASGRSGCEQFPRPEYDPVDRVAVWKPSHPLEPGVRYTVVIRPPEDESDMEGIRAFDGAPLEAPYIFSFTTERRSPCTEHSDCTGSARCECQDQACTRTTCQLPSREPKRHIDYCYEPVELCAFSTGACLLSERMPMTTPGPRKQLHGCATARCHGADSGETGLVGPSGHGALLLENDGIRHYVGKVARTTATSPNPTAVNRSGIPFGVNMPYVDPGFSANSYLLWKLVLGLEGKDAVVKRSVHSADGYRCEDVAELFHTEAPANETCPPPPAVPPLARAGEVRPDPVEAWILPELSQPIAEGEYERLRRALRGHGMPLGPDATTHPGLVRTISAWITAGAPAPDCP